MEACRECKFWEKMAKDHGGCRRYPPQVTEDPTASSIRSRYNSTFPETKGDDWCGEFIFDKSRQRPGAADPM